MNQFSNTFQHAQFILKYLRDELTVQEKNELETWLAANENNGILFDELTNEQLLKNELQFFENQSTDIAWQKMEARISPKTKLVSINKNRRWWYLAAAAIFLIGAFAIYRFVIEQPSANTPIAKTQIVKDDIAPGGNKAILTLADGSTIILDNAANGDLTNQGNTKVIKLDGQLAYTTNGKTTEVIYNTISTPMGGQYQLVLADGSKVWLNAASSLRFPANFIGSERKVELTGEGYFEVAKNATMSFKVDVAGKGEVEVLGTHFNINAYSDEASINTTLLEGSVKVKALSSDKSLLLSPGHQAQLNTNGQITINSRPDIDQVMAWKNGKFYFGNAMDIKDVMRQISRWYNVDIKYLKPIELHIGGGISRDVNLSDVLKMLEATGVLKFWVEDKTITVMVK